MGERTRVSLVDEYGKLKGSATVHELKRAKYTRGFMTTFTDSKPYLVDLLSHFELRVLARLEQRMDYGNWSPVVSEDLAKEMDAAEPNISRAMKSLLQKGVIERAPRELKNGRTWQYRLNADYGWKGDAIEWHQHQRERVKMGGVVQLFPVGSMEQKQKHGNDSVRAGRGRKKDDELAAAEMEAKGQANLFTP